MATENPTPTEQATGLLDKDGKPIMREIATRASDPFRWNFGNTLTNEDDTLISRGGGKGLKIYDELERDGQVYSDLDKRKRSVIAEPWTVEPASESRIDKKAAALVKDVISAVNFDQVCFDLLDAILKGFAVSEIMWARDGALTYPAKIKQKDQRRFTFDTEEQLRLLTRANLVDGEPVPRNKFIVHRFGGKDGTPFGKGLGSILFWYVLFKRQNITSWLIFNDKFGNPTAVGKYPQGTSADEQKKLLAALTSISQDTGIIVPDGMVIELLEAARSGNMSSYEMMCRYMDEQISRTILGQTDSSRSAGGALKAASDNRADEGQSQRQGDSDLLTITIDEQLVAPILEYNGIQVMKRPKVWRDFTPEEDKKQNVEVDKGIHEMGYRPRSPQYINDKYGGDWVEAPKPTPPVPPGGKLFTQKEGDRLPVVELAEAAGFPDQAALDAAIDAIPDATNQALIEAVLRPVFKLVAESADGMEAMSRLAEIYPLMATDRIERLLARAMFVAEVWGRIAETAETDTESA